MSMHLLGKMFTRARLIPAVLVAALLASLSFLAAQPPASGTGSGKGQNGAADRADIAAPLSELAVVRRVNAATDRALDYLEKQQIKEGDTAGCWRADINAINAVAILAFLSRGHVPGRGKYGDTIEGGVVKPGVLTRAKKFILSRQSKLKHNEGYLALGGRMYDHGLTTLALAEMYGMDPDPELEAGLRKAVNLILRAQGTVGGWNYEPTASDGDLSVSVMQIVAMRAAANAEIPVPETAVKKAINYVRGKANRNGPGFGYRGADAGTPQTSAAGCLSLQLLGAYNDPQIGKTLDYLAASMKPGNWKGSGANYYYYFNYYAMQAFYQHGGKHWNEWHPKVRETLLAKQNKDGSWDTPPDDQAEAGYAANKTYPTAFATLVLNIYQHYLPAYQR